MAEIGDQQESVEHNQMLHAKVFPMPPPVTEAKKEERYAQGEVIKAHKEQVVVGEDESEPAEQVAAFMNAIEEVDKRDRHEPNGKRDKDFFGDKRWKHIEQ